VTFNFLCIIEVYDQGSSTIMDPTPMRENTTKMFSIPTKQMSPTPSAITIDLVEAQFSSTFVTNLFHSDAIKLEHPTTQIDVVMNAKEVGEWRHLLQEVLPKIAQEDPYLIRLLIQQKYIEIV
jgi:hypothetical protein